MRVYIRHTLCISRVDGAFVLHPCRRLHPTTTGRSSMSQSRPIRAVFLLIAGLALLCFTMASALPVSAQQATPSTGSAATGDPMTTVQVVQTVAPAVVTVINEQQST